MRKLITWGAIVGALFIAALVTISYAVSTHTEPVWLFACPTVGGAAEYTEPVEGSTQRACDDPQPVRWRSSDFPLTVQASSARGHLSPLDRRVLEGALRAFNAQVGFHAFALSLDIPFPQVSIVLHVPTEAGAPAATVRHWLRDDGTIVAAMVEVGNVPDDATLHVVLLHEAGHVVGLAHDEWVGSLMSATTLEGGSPHRPPARLTDLDRAELRTVYLPL